MTKPKSKARGFAGMDRDVLAKIAQAGGLAVHAKGTSYQFTSETARAAARKRHSRTPSNFNDTKGTS